MTDQRSRSMSTPTPTVRVDVRNRVSLGKNVPTGSLFFIEVQDDGVIKLTPAVAVPLGSLQI